MDNKVIDLATANNWDDSVDWATDEEWVRAAANLEAETDVDILIGADLGNNLDFYDKIIPTQNPDSSNCRKISSAFSSKASSDKGGS
jgi:hypothetical protein